MKKILFSFLTTWSVFNIHAQSIAINTDKSAPNASAILDIKSTNKGLLIPRMTTVQRTAIATPAKGLMVFDISTNSCWFYNGTAWTPVAGSGNTNYWSVNSFGDIYNNTLGFVGIGTSTPSEKFTIQTQTGQFGLSHTDGTVKLASYIGEFNGGLGGWLGTRSNHPLYFFTGNSAQQMTLLPNGNVGIGTINPINKLQIGNVPGFTNYDFGIGNGTQAMVFQQNSGFSNWQSNTNITLLPTNATGNVGINTVSPNNKLQIGDVTNGFNGNDIAIGNGTGALGVAQTPSVAQFASNTDFIFLPRFGSTGRVGINTSTPKAPLDVEGFTSFNIANANGGDYAYYSVGTNSNFNYVAIYGAIQSATPVPVSIYAAQRVVGSEFDAFSDARIKNIIGNSNGITDLETINALQVKDYTMKDRVKYGNKPYKKVIAQEVEKVYPQVISKHTDFIPNVYQVTNKITKTDSGYLLSFFTNHKIDRNAKKLQLISETGTQQFDIVAIPSDREVIIDAKNIKGDKLFVYGEEVNDFRTVDYEGLTTLNISATQEISRILTAQDKTIRQQEKNIQQQNKRIAAMEETIELLKRRSAVKSFSK